MWRLGPFPRLRTLGEELVGEPYDHTYRKQHPRAEQFLLVEDLHGRYSLM